jgi:uncharacterized membrane protein YfcA
MQPDTVNGIFELVGSLFILLHCRRLFKDKRVAGVSVVAVVFFVAWGLWNLYYYPHLGQWYSFVGGVAIVSANALWVSMLIYYRKK